MRRQLFFGQSLQMSEFEAILKIYGIDVVGAQTQFTRDELVTKNIVEEVRQIIPMLEKYYIPCKARMYLNDLDAQKCITILRQVLRLKGCNLLSQQRMRHGQKRVEYTIVWSESLSNKTPEPVQDVFVSFD
jgi:hypothetical protein